MSIESLHITSLMKVANCLELRKHKLGYVTWARLVRFALDRADAADRISPDSLSQSLRTLDEVLH